VLPIALELVAPDVEPAARLRNGGVDGVVDENALDDQLALARPVARDAKVDRIDHRVAREIVLRHRDLLADDGREIAVEGEHELLDLLAERVARSVGPEATVEHSRVVEAEDGVDAPVVEKAKTT